MFLRSTTGTEKLLEIFEKETNIIRKEKYKFIHTQVESSILPHLFRNR